MAPFARIVPFLLAAAVALIWAQPASAASAPAEDSATAASGCKLSLAPASRNVRRGGKVLLRGVACGAAAASNSRSSVRVTLQKQGRRWATVAQVQTDTSGRFKVCAPVRVPKASKVARLRATAEGSTGATTVRIARKGRKGCGSGGDGSAAPSEAGNPDCPLSQPGSEIGLSLPAACTVVASDTGSSADPTGFWDRVECQTSSRHQRLTSGGDTHTDGLGNGQGNESFRRLTVYDGDDFYGERCELGHNNMNAPTAFYREGMRRATFASIRMPSNSPISNPNWRNVLQMKQAQPYNNPNPASIFELQVRASRWEVGSDWNGVWSTQATQNTWTRFAFDIVYSKDPTVGSIKIYVDLNGDGDADDAGEQSPRVQKQTLQSETSPAHPDGVGAGKSIPSHLRAGIYQDENSGCPSGCSVDIDNFQVIRP